jgi:DNA (cytosine-5)-methyltransferase 1
MPLDDVSVLITRKKQTSISSLDCVVDLFCGAGGMAEGFRFAGFHSVLGVDAWAPAAETFARAHDTANVILGGVESLTENVLLDAVGRGPHEVGILCGGPPCQGFSLAGKTLADDPRNALYKEFLNAIRILLPAWVVMENVPALLSNPTVGPAIHSDFESIQMGKSAAYDVRHVVVNAAAYGVPQTRTRVLFIAKRKDVRTTTPFEPKQWLRPLFNELSDTQELFGGKRYLSVDDAISDLPLIQAGEGSDEMPYAAPANTPYQSLMRGELSLKEYCLHESLPKPVRAATIPRAKGVFNHQAQEHSALLVERFDNIPAGGSKEDLRKNRPDLLPPDGHPEQGLTYGRLWADRPAPTIPANYSRPSGNRSIHPHVPRLITPREAMRLSSFPDYYFLTGGKVAQREQVGNAVPPLLAFAVADQILRAWKR